MFKDSTMQKFMDHHLATPTPTVDIQTVTLTVMNPAATGSLAGVLVEQLRTPYRYVNS
jgi:hypothetical protein